MRNKLIYFLLMQPTLLRASEAGLTGASSKEGKCAESPPRFICGKRQKNQRKPVMKNIPDSGVVFTFEEGISTSHVCPKGQQH